MPKVSTPLSVKSISASSEARRVQPLLPVPCPVLVPNLIFVVEDMLVDDDDMNRIRGTVVVTADVTVTVPTAAVGISWKNIVSFVDTKANPVTTAPVGPKVIDPCNAYSFAPT